MRYIGDYSDDLGLISGKAYRVVGENTHCYAVIDETGEDYLYLKENFEDVGISPSAACAKPANS